MPDPIDDLVQRWRQNPNPAATVELCDALRGSVRAALVQQVGEFAAQRHSGDVAVMLAVARMYLEGHRLSEAQSALVAAGKAAPREADIYRWLGEVLLRRGDAERAEKVLERAIQLGTRDGDARLWLERARVFRPMQAKAGPRAVAAEVARGSSHQSPSPARAAPPAPHPPKIGQWDEDSDDSETLVHQAPKVGENGPVGLMRPPSASEASLVLPSHRTSPYPPATSAADPAPVSTIPMASSPRAHDAETRPVAFPTPASPQAILGTGSVEFDLSKGALKLPSAKPPAAVAAPAVPLVPPSSPRRPPAPPESEPNFVPPPVSANPFAAPNPFFTEAPKPRADDFARPRVDDVFRARPESGPMVPHPRDVLDALALAGVFEPPTGAAPAAASWDRPAQGVRRRAATALLVVATTLLLGGGIGTFFYVRSVRQQQHEQAEAILAKLERDLAASKPDLLPGAEQALGQVFELESRSPRASLDWLHERALVGLLKNGADVAFEDALTRAKDVGVPDEKIAFARVASFLFQGDVTGAAGMLPRYDGPTADGPATKDAWYQLMAGETLERAGDSRARDRYAAAGKLDPSLVLVDVALARSTAIDGDPHQAADLAKQFRSKYPDRVEGSALAALAWGRDPGRTEQAPPDVDETIRRAGELPLSLTFVPHALAALRAVDKHQFEDATAAIKKGLAAADGPGVAAWLGSIAVTMGDEQLAGKAALVAVSYSALYQPAMVLAARVALAADRIDDAVKATENLDATSPDVAIVHAAASYERVDANGLGQALEAVPLDAQKLPFLAPLGMAQRVLLGRAQLTPDKIIDMSDDEAPWADLLAMDLALDEGEMEAADRVAATWKGTEGRPLRALRLARLARYEGRTDVADALSDAAMHGTVTARVLFERVFVLVAKNRAGEVGPLLAKYPAILGRDLSTWLGAYALASGGKSDEAKARIAQLDPPPALTPLPVRAVAASSFGALKDKKRGVDYIKELFETGTQHPDVVNAALALGFKKVERRGRKPTYEPPAF